MYEHWVGCGCTNCRWEQTVREIQEREPLQRELEQKLTMPASQPVECPRCQKMVDGVHTCSPQKPQPVDYAAFLYAEAGDAILLRDQETFAFLANHLTALRVTKRGCGISVHGYSCGRVWDNGTIHLCDLCEFRLFECIAALMHTTQGKER